MSLATYLRLVYSAVAPTLTDGKDVAAQCDASGNLKTVSGGGASGLALETGGNLATAVTRLGTIATNTAPGAAATSNAETSLSTTNATQLPSQAATVGVWVSCPLANTAAVYIGSSGVTTSTGVELQPGDREFFPVANSNLLYARTGTATQSVRSLVV